MKRLLIFLFLISSCFSKALYGQILHPDPYQIDLYNFFLGFSRQEVLGNRISTITLLDYRLKRDGTKKKNPTIDFRIEFDTLGNPVHYKYIENTSYKLSTEIKQKIGIEKERITSNDYIFYYDSLNNLIHAEEKEVNPFSHSQRLNDYYFYFDESSKLTKQVISRKHIYKPGYKYRGVLYYNDTSTVAYFFNYNDDNAVTNVLRKQTYCDYYRSNEEVDTLPYNCSFDSIFISSELPKGIKVDSSGRVVERTNYATRVMFLGGSCEPVESPYDQIGKYFYDDYGKLVKVEWNSRQGELLKRRLWKYNERGLILSTYEEGDKHLSCYEYEYF